MPHQRRHDAKQATKTKRSDLSKLPTLSPTGHRGNIFGVAFLPATNDSVIVSGAMDSEVRLHRLAPDGDVQTSSYECHRGRVKAVSVSEARAAMSRVRSHGGAGRHSSPGCPPLSWLR